MSEKQKLIDALRRSAQTEWGTAALSALDDQQVVFAGSPGAGNTAGDLLRIYRLKLIHSRKAGIVAHGIVELIESLARRTTDTIIDVQPFRGPESSVGAFWDATGNLVGCVTIFGGDRERGRRNLDFALGKRLGLVAPTSACDAELRLTQQTAGNGFGAINNTSNDTNLVARRSAFAAILRPMLRS